MRYAGYRISFGSVCGAGWTPAVTLVQIPFPKDPARYSRALLVRSAFPLVDLGGSFSLFNHLAGVLVLQVHRPQRVHVIARHRENLNKLVAKLGRVVGQGAEFFERVAKVVSVRVDNRGTNLAPNFAEEDEVRLHVAPPLRTTVVVHRSQCLRAGTRRVAVPTNGTTARGFGSNNVGF